MVVDGKKEWTLWCFCTIWTPVKKVLKTKLDIFDPQWRRLLGYDYFFLHLSAPIQDILLGRHHRLPGKCLQTSLVLHHDFLGAQSAGLTGTRLYGTQLQYCGCKTRFGQKSVDMGMVLFTFFPEFLFVITSHVSRRLGCLSLSCCRPGISR